MKVHTHISKKPQGLRVTTIAHSPTIQFQESEINDMNQEIQNNHSIQEQNNNMNQD